MEREWKVADFTPDTSELATATRKLQRPGPAELLCPSKVICHLKGTEGRDAPSSTRLWCLWNLFPARAFPFLAVS